MEATTSFLARLTERMTTIVGLGNFVKSKLELLSLDANHIAFSELITDWCERTPASSALEAVTIAPYRRETLKRR